MAFLVRSDIHSGSRAGSDSSRRPYPRQQRMQVVVSEAQRTKRTLAEAEKRHDHARRCKKLLDECIVCQGNIAWFATLSPAMLSRVLQETPTA